MLPQLTEAAEIPPQQAPEEQEVRKGEFIRGELCPARVQDSGSVRRGDADHQRSQVCSGRHCRPGKNRKSERATRGKLQQRTEGTRQSPTLTAAHPEERSPFERPACGAPAPVERE